MKNGVKNVQAAPYNGACMVNGYFFILENCKEVKQLISFYEEETKFTKLCHSIKYVNEFKNLIVTLTCTLQKINFTTTQ